MSTMMGFRYVESGLQVQLEKDEGSSIRQMDGWSGQCSNGSVKV